MVTWVEATTGAVAIPNVALPAPWGILKPSGTATAALLAKNCTNTPPGPAGSLSVAVPVELCPPTNTDGSTVSDASVTTGAGAGAGAGVGAGAGAGATGGRRSLPQADASSRAATASRVMKSGARFAGTKDLRIRKRLLSYHLG